MECKAYNVSSFDIIAVCSPISRYVHEFVYFFSLMHNIRKIVTNIESEVDVCLHSMLKHMPCVCLNQIKEILGNHDIKTDR